MSKRFLWVIIGIALLHIPALGGDAKKDDAHAIRGAWRIVSVDGAERVPPAELKKIRIRITADKLVIENDGKEIQSPSFKLNPSKNPKEIDLVVQVLIDKKTEVLRDFLPRQGIYDLNGDDLKICVAWATNKMTPDPAARPKEFKSGGDVTVMVLKRDK